MIEQFWNDSTKIYRNNKTYSEYWTNRFQDTLYNAVNNRVLSLKLQNDIWSSNLIPRLNRLTDDNNDILKCENVLSSWCNLLNEWCNRHINKYYRTYLYIAKIKYHTRFRKIGITWNLDNRQFMSNNRYYDYTILREYNNRYAAAYAEYKLRTKFCRENEIVDENQIQNIINYVNTIKENKRELILLGWNYTNGI